MLGSNSHGSLCLSFFGRALVA